MKLGILYFTPGGERLARKIQAAAGELGMEPVLWDGRRREGEDSGARQLVERAFAEKWGLLFVGACGIAVRMIAPFVRDKLTDAPVLVADEGGSFVIPVLSGHMGGANELAERLAGILGAVPVITTATDVNGRFAVDVFAKKHRLAIRNREGIAEVSAEILAGKRLSIAIEGVELPEQGMPEELIPKPFPPTEPVDILVAREAAREQLWQKERLLWLEPREYVLGMGCRRGKGCGELAAFARSHCERLGIDQELVCALATIDRKRDEAGLLELAALWKLEFVTYPAERLMEAEGAFAVSEFVEETVGVDNVCERAAALYCGEGGEMLLPKTAAEGMTLAVGRRPWSFQGWR